MEPNEISRPVTLTYQSRARLNRFQTFSIYILRVAGAALIISASSDLIGIFYSKALGYYMAPSLFFPIAEYMVAGLFVVIFARRIGQWFGSGLGETDNT